MRGSSGLPLGGWHLLHLASPLFAGMRISGVMTAMLTLGCTIFPPTAGHEGAYGAAGQQPGPAHSAPALSGAVVAAAAAASAQRSAVPPALATTQSEVAANDTRHGCSLGGVLPPAAARPTRPNFSFSVRRASRSEIELCIFGGQRHSFLCVIY